MEIISEGVMERRQGGYGGQGRQGWAEKGEFVCNKFLGHKPFFFFFLCLVCLTFRQEWTRLPGMSQFWETENMGDFQDPFVTLV